MAFARIKILTLVFLASILSFVSSDTEKIVNTTHGPVRGESIVLTTKKVLIRYLGIPFARAKRFEAPQSPTSWTVPLNATSFGYSCWQGISIIVESNVTMSEDCLTVNVFIPETGSRLLPVMVFIYGGGFSFGSSAYRIYNGQYLATEGEVVVVTFNYRLGVLGFLSKGTKDLLGNYGLLDQVKALHWVQENIERFGGDPKQVTIFGQSAGAASVALHMLSPLSRGLYHKVILESGTAASLFAGMPQKTALETARAFASNIGCDMHGLKGCLKDKNIRNIMNAQFAVAKDDMSRFPPVADHYFLKDLPINLLLRGEFNQVGISAIIGVTQNEGAFFVMPIKGLVPGIRGIDKGLNKTTFDTLVKGNKRWVYNQTEKVPDAIIFEYTDWTNKTNPLVVRKQYIDVITDSSFKAPAILSAKAFVDKKIKTYFYSFDYYHSSHFPSWAGVFHSADLPFVFGSYFDHYNSSVSLGEQGVKIIFAKTVMTMWSNFAKNGTPADPKTWPEYTLENQEYISLKPSSSVEKDLLPEKMAFWNSLVPLLTKPEPSDTPVKPTVMPCKEKFYKGTKPGLIAAVVVLAILVVVLIAFVCRLKGQLKAEKTASVPSEYETSKLIHSSGCV